MRLRRSGGDRAVAPVDWLVVGLGNPGTRYAGTPHNVGVEVANELARRWDLPQGRTKFNALVTEGRANAAHPPARVAVLIPQTYMNESGRAVGPARGAFRVDDLAHVLVCHDEIDLPFGEVRARVGGGLAGHNGLKSLRRELGDPGFTRVRIGVGRPDSSEPDVVAAHVLGRWRQPASEVKALIESAADAAEAIVRDGPPQP